MSDDAPVDARDLRHERELRELWQQTHLNVHVAEREALKTAATEINRRLEGMNELRVQITEERGRYVQREWFDREHQTLREAMDARLKFLENSASNLQGRFWMAVAVTGALMTLALHFWK